MRLSRPVILLAIGACAACEGVVAGDARSLDDFPGLSLVEELRIGSLDDPDRGFSRIGTAIEVVEGDTVFVPETSVPEIRVYAPNGRLARRFGRRGDGPGELQSVLYWGIVGDTVWVIGGAAASRRITLFRRDGSLIGTVPPMQLEIQAGGIVARVAPVELLPGGRYLGRLISYGIPQSGPAVALRVPEVVFDASGTVVDTLGFRELNVEPMSSRDQTMLGTVRIFGGDPLPFFRLGGAHGTDSIAVERPVAAASERAELTLLRFTSEGDTVFHKVFSYVPRQVDDTTADRLIEGRMDTYRNRVDNLASLEQAVRSVTPIPAFFPPVATMTLGRDGSIWLRRHPEDSAEWRWLLFSPGGEPRGEVVTRAGARILWHRDDVLYVVEPDDFEVPWLVRYRLEPAG